MKLKEKAKAFWTKHDIQIVTVTTALGTGVLALASAYLGAMVATRNLQIDVYQWRPEDEKNPEFTFITHRYMK